MSVTDKLFRWKECPLEIIKHQFVKQMIFDVLQLAAICLEILVKIHKFTIKICKLHPNIRNKIPKQRKNCGKGKHKKINNIKIIIKINFTIAHPHWKTQKRLSPHVTIKIRILCEKRASRNIQRANVASIHFTTRILRERRNLTFSLRFMMLILWAVISEAKYRETWERHAFCDARDKNYTKNTILWNW